MLQVAHQAWQALGSTLPAHTVILTLVADLDDPEALQIVRGHMADVLTALGTACRMLQGEPLPPERLARSLMAMVASSKELGRRLKAQPSEKQPLVRRIQQLADTTNPVEERLLALVQ